MTSTRCKICEHATKPIGSAQVLARHQVMYYRCPRCGFTQTEEPYWLDEAYSDAITSSDIGLVGRNLALAQVTRAVIALFFNGGARFIDFGAGYGLFVRMMRDFGFDFYWHDQFCANLFAKGFDANLSPTQPYELLTAFEVFEHLRDPVPEVEQMLRYAPSVLFTTQLLPHTEPAPGQWWYYGLEHGQHVGIFSGASLRHLAGRLNCHLYSDGSFVHLLTPKRLPGPIFRLATHHRAAAFVAVAARRPSLLPADYYRLVGRKLE